MLTLRTIFGAGWTVGARLAGRIIDIGTLLLLARILAPADFGLTALAISIIAVIDMVLEVPLVQALTRLPAIDKRHLDTAFTLGLLRSVLVVVTVVVLAWPISLIYGEPRLVALVAVLSLSPASRSLFSPALAHLMRDIRFREMFIIQVAGKVCAALVAAAALWAGAGYWAIVGNNVASNVVTMLLTYVVAPYLPSFSLKRFGDFSGFMGWFTASQVIAALNWQLDRLLLGGAIPAATLGKYSMASDLSVIPMQTFLGPAMSAVIAGFSRINQDTERLKSAFMKAVRIAMLIAFPSCVFLSLGAPLLVDLLFDDRWTDAVIYLQVLALIVLPTAYNPVVQAYALATDRPRIVAEINAIDLALKIVALPLGLYFFSIWGVLIAKGVTTLLVLGVWVFYSRTYARVTIAAQLRNLREVSLATAVMAASVWLVLQIDLIANAPTLVALIVAGATAGVTYLGALYASGLRVRSFLGARA